jgi:glycerate 2-kinase
MDQRQTAIDIFLAGVESVKPDNLIRSYVSVRNNRFLIENLTFDLSEVKNIYVAGVGKASALMAKELESVLGSRITRGHIVTKYGHSVPLKYIGITEAGHPVPDENGLKGTDEILSIARMAKEDDIFICLISGGGSALLTDVPEGCTLKDLRALNDVLLKSGANISEMNCIRKHLSRVKGGMLAKAAFPARVISLILSDVIGDPVGVIASGPTAPDPTTFADALSILKIYQIENDIPACIYKALRDGFDKKIGETLKEFDEIFLTTSNLIIGTNKLALKTAKMKAESLGFESKIISDTIDGDVAEVARYIFQISISTQELKSGKKICLLFGGEPTLKVTGEGLGGRNQHLALTIASLLKDTPAITFLSGGTDGTDGSTDAAGAVVDSFTWQNADKLKLNSKKYIENFDSYHFFKKAGGLITTGPTQTNVMDMMIALIE